MAISASTAWRIRAGGNNANGGGFDVAVSGTLATTLNGSLTNSTTTVVVTSATGWPGSGNYYARIGNLGPETFSSGGTGSSEIVLVTAGQGTTSWTVTRGQFGTAAQAFATGVVVDNDLSRCDTAPLSGSVGTSTASTTFVDATATFDLTCVGNIIWIASGAGATVGAYIIQSRTNATTVVLDRVSGTYTAGVWRMGGAWADPKTNTEGTMVPGNITYIRAGGSGTWASGTGTTDYTLTTRINCPAGDLTNGVNRWIGENGKPYIKAPSADCLVFYQAEGNNFENLYLIASSTTNGGIGVIGASNNAAALGHVVRNCVLDQNGLDVNGIRLAGGSLIDSEVYSSTPNSGTAGVQYGVFGAANNFGGLVSNCNIHDCWGHGGLAYNSLSFIGNVIAKNRGSGLEIDNPANNSSVALIVGNTIDGNFSHGIDVLSSTGLRQMVILGNTLSNHNQASKYGIRCNFLSAGANDRIKGLVDNNTFYNNTADSLNLTVTSGVNYGHVQVNNIGVDPGFVAQSTENYATGTNLQNLGFPQAAFLQSKSGQTTGVRNYMDPGAVQRTGVTPVATTGTASLNFGATPGAFEASVVVTGQAGIVAGSLLECWILPATTADHSNDEHILNPPRVIAGTIVAGTGFTIYGFSPESGAMPTLATGSDRLQDGKSESNPPRCYGVWNVGWVWV